MPGPRTYPRGHTAEVYQEKRYWQSAVSWLNSGIPSFTEGSQWKKMVEETDFVLSFPHFEDEVNTTSRSPSVGEEAHTTATSAPTPQRRAECVGRARRRFARTSNQIRASFIRRSTGALLTDPLTRYGAPASSQCAGKTCTSPKKRSGLCPQLTICSGVEAGHVVSAYLETEIGR